MSNRTSRDGATLSVRKASQLKQYTIRCKHGATISLPGDSTALVDALGEHASAYGCSCADRLIRQYVRPKTVAL